MTIDHGLWKFVIGKSSALGLIWLYTPLEKGEWPLTLRSPKYAKFSTLDNVFMVSLIIVESKQVPRLNYNEEDHKAQKSLIGQYLVI